MCVCVCVCGGEGGQTPQMGVDGGTDEWLSWGGGGGGGGEGEDACSASLALRLGYSLVSRQFARP